MSDTGQLRARHLSSFHLEAMRLGAASAAEQTWAEEHLRECARCVALAASLESSRQEFVRFVAPRARAAIVGRMVRRRPWIWAAAGLLVPAVAALALFLVGSAGHEEPVVEPELGVKGGGGPSLLVAVRRGNRVFPAKPGSVLVPGDQIRFVLGPAGRRFVLIASVDGTDRASVYVPYDGTQSMALPPGDRVEVPDSIVIDASPGPERLFAFFSQQPLPAARIRQALVALGARGHAAIRSTTHLEVGADAQSSILLEKGAP
jgi:hypothetical protein